jgi:hypothetical protein
MQGLTDAAFERLCGKRNEGSGTARKTLVIAAAERWACGRMGAVFMPVVDSFYNQAAAAFRDSHIALGAVVHTDCMQKVLRLNPDAICPDS